MCENLSIFSKPPGIDSNHNNINIIINIKTEKIQLK